MLDLIFKKEENEKIEMELRSEFDGPVSCKMMTNVQIDYLPYVIKNDPNENIEDQVASKPYLGIRKLSCPAEKNGVITNYLVKRIFRDFQLILELWKIKIDQSDPHNKKTETTKLVDSVINDTPGKLSHPCFADYEFFNGTLAWITIDQNWLDDTYSLNYNHYDL